MPSNLSRRSAIQWAGAAFVLPNGNYQSNLLENGQMPFTPKFIDLVRSVATVTGNGPVTIGSAVSGFTSLADAVGTGDQFYYAIQGVDKPQEREVGRGTMQADGRVGRQAIGGSLTNFTSGTKTIALVTPAEWFARLDGAMVSAASRAELAGKEGQANARAYLAEGARAGTFVFDPADHAAMVAADPRQGLFIAPASDPSGASGAWVRAGWRELDPRWFGAIADDASDASPAINAAFRMAEMLAVGGSTNPTIYRGGPAIDLGFGKFFCASSWEPLATLRVQGAGGLGWGAATQIRFPAGVTAIRAQAHNTSGAAAVDGTPHFAGDALVIQDVYFLGGFAGTEGEYHGVHAKRPVHIERCTFDGFQGDGLHGHTSFGGGAPNEGNSNVLRAINCVVTNCRSGYSALGADANAWTLVGCSFMQNRRWGIEERGFLGNHNYGHHYDGNARTSWNTGATGRPCSYVSHGGNWYFAIDGQEAGASTNAPSGTTADNSWWGHWQPGAPSPGSGIPAWTNGINVRSGGAILIGGLSNGSSAIGCHVENNGVSQLDQGALVTGVVPYCVAVSGGVLARNRVGTVIAASGGLRFGGNLNVLGDFNCQSVTNHIGPQMGVAADSELRLHNSNVASVIKGYSWPSGTSSGEIWVSYSGINGMLLRGQQKIRFDIAGLEQCSVGPGGFDTASNTKVYKVNGVQVAGPRKTGWATATGNATRSTFDTSSVTLTQLAERVKALIDDLHGAAGHGLIGT